MITAPTDMLHSVRFSPNPRFVVPAKPLTSNRITLNLLRFGRIAFWGKPFTSLVDLLLGLDRRGADGLCRRRGFSPPADSRVPTASGDKIADAANCRGLQCNSGFQPDSAICDKLRVSL
jgi:hypothetical protein